VRHSLGVTGLALLVAGSVAFLPLGSAGSAADQGDSTLGAATSLEALRSVFVTPVEAGTAEAGSAPAAASPSPETALAAVAPPALETPSMPAPTASPTEPVAQAIITSALQQATPTAPAAVVATAVPVATPVRTSVSIPAIEEVLARSPWPRELWPTVERIIICESSGNPGAVSPAGYVGLMQVAPWLHGAVPADPVAQLAQAYEVYLRQGWGAWGCY